MLAYNTPVWGNIMAWKKLGVGVQNLVGKFCKHVRVRLVFRMVLWSRLGAAAET